MKPAWCCLALVACSSHSANPTVLVTNMTGQPLNVVVYDYSTPVMTLPGIPFSPETDVGTVGSGIGTVGGAGTACLRLSGIKVSDAFALVGEDTSGAAATPPTGTFVPQDSPGWTVTFTSITAAPTGPAKTETGCLATP